jgi:hypothetical protein
MHFAYVYVNASGDCMHTIADGVAHCPEQSAADAHQACPCCTQLRAQPRRMGRASAITTITTCLEGGAAAQEAKQCGSLA